MNAMPRNSDLPAQAKPPGRRPASKTADAPNRVARDWANVFGQFAAIRARAAKHAAKIAEQAGHEKYEAAQRTRNRWNERIRSILASTMPVARFVYDVPQLSADPAFPDAIIKPPSEVDGASIKPMTEATDRPGAPQAMPSRSVNGGRRPQASREQLDHLLRASRPSPEVVRATLSAKYWSGGSLHKKILSEARIDESRKLQAHGQLPLGEAPESTGRIAAFPLAITSQATKIAAHTNASVFRLISTERREKLLADSLERAVREVPRRVNSPATGPFLSGTFASGVQDRGMTQRLEEATRPSSSDVGGNRPEWDSVIVGGRGSIPAAAAIGSPGGLPSKNRPMPLSQLPVSFDADDQESPEWLKSLVSQQHFSPERRFGPISRDVVRQHGRPLFDPQVRRCLVSQHVGAVAQRAIFEQPTTSGFKMLEGSIARTSSTSPLARERLSGTSEPTRGASGATQGPGIDMDRLARAIEMFIQGLERFAETGRFAAFQSGRSQVLSVPPALPAKPASFPGRTDGGGAPF
jgi:hypothetical protein